MKTIYIPKGEAKNYEHLFTDNLVVNGYLNVEKELKAKHISGSGIITAGRITADDITADEIETSSIICKRLMAKRVSAAEVYASACAAVSCFLEASYVETGRLTTAFSEVSEVKADEVIHLPAKKRGLVLTLFLSALRSFWLALTSPSGTTEFAEYTPPHGKDVADDGDDESSADREVREEIARNVHEFMEEELRKVRQQESSMDAEDYELKRFVSIFKLLRDQGYTLRVLPGTPEENAPVFDFEDERIRTAA